MVKSSQHFLYVPLAANILCVDSTKVVERLIIYHKYFTDYFNFLADFLFHYYSIERDTNIYRFKMPF